YPLVKQTAHRFFLDILDALGNMREVPGYPLIASQTMVSLPVRKAYYDNDISVTIKGLRIGDVVLLAVSGEVFNGYIKKIEMQSPFAYSLFSGLANGYKGYIPTREAYMDGLGGYEMKTTPYVAQVDEVFVEAAARFLQGLEN